MFVLYFVPLQFDLSSNAPFQSQIDSNCNPKYFPLYAYKIYTYLRVPKHIQTQMDQHSTQLAKLSRCHDLNVPTRKHGL